ncbi:hypothetical protein JW707_02620 [Candidatus Woesearchaeota archaeon]|nr:hypothetical protein [Candidatus Woesearchaeota archaeon]
MRTIEILYWRNSDDQAMEGWGRWNYQAVLFQRHQDEPYESSLYGSVDDLAREIPNMVKGEDRELAYVAGYKNDCNRPGIFPANVQREGVLRQDATISNDDLARLVDKAQEAMKQKQDAA